MASLLIRGDARRLPLASGIVQCCATSPPFWSLRDYGVPPSDWAAVRYRPMAGLPETSVPAMRCCLGLEPTPEAFVGHIVAVFREVRRVLRDDGVAFVNFGDSYCSTAPATMGDPLRCEGILAGVRQRTAEARRKYRPDTPSGLKPKDLVGIPWRVAFALQADGWWLRSDIISDIIWEKPNPMPESVTDRVTKAHEYVFVLTKSERYFYDGEAIKEDAVYAGADANRVHAGEMEQAHDPVRFRTRPMGRTCGYPDRRNRRSVWKVATKPTPDAHFATWPPALVEPMILAGTSEKGCCPACGAPWRRVVQHREVLLRPNSNSRRGHCPSAGRTSTPQRGAVSCESKTLGWQPSCSCPADGPIPCLVLDPFVGSGTTLEVAELLGRSAIGVDLNPTYLSEIATKRAERGSRPHKDEVPAGIGGVKPLPGQLGLFPDEVSP
jgi:hypothetical protein